MPESNQQLSAGQFSKRGFEIQRAGLSDIGELVKICRISFPMSPRWQGPDSLGRKWWQTALNAEEVESWVLSDSNAIAAFCAIIINEDRWAER